jgi:dUTP pyrophosphatase
MTLGQGGAVIFMERKDGYLNRVGEFEKVSYEQFLNAMLDILDESEAEIRSLYDDLQLPTRATSGSAGYDFKAPFGFTLKPGGSMKIPTGIRVKIEEGWWLGCLPRSGLGFKYRFKLENTMGVIDSDYYYSDNEGHIFAKITNDSKHRHDDVSVEEGGSFIQAIFLPYGITHSDNATGVRNGGMGSTGT